MTKFICMLLLGGFLLACSPQASNSKANVALIEQYVAAVENKDLDAMESLLADGYVGIGPSVSDTITKDDAVASWKENSANLYESIEYTKSRILPVKVTDGDYPGDWVTNFALLTIKYQNGDEAQVLANTSYMIENNQITRTFTFYNEADVMEQLNYVFIDLDDITR